jgi:hypothetical protein
LTHDRSLSNEEIRGALRAVLDVAGDLVDSLQFCLVGTASSRVRGIPLPVGDVEFVAADRATVDALSARITDARPDLRPWRDERARPGLDGATGPSLLETPVIWFYSVSWQIGDVVIGWSTCEPPGGLPKDPATLPAGLRAMYDSDLYECLGRAPWLHNDEVSVAGHRIPCVATELRLVSELVRGRPDRYERIFDFLEGREVDGELLARSVAHRGVAIDTHPRLARLLT